jgi:hypothetical protein
MLKIRGKKHCRPTASKTSRSGYFFRLFVRLRCVTNRELTMLGTFREEKRFASRILYALAENSSDEDESISCHLRYAQEEEKRKPEARLLDDIIARMSEERYKALFRFYKGDIRRMQGALQVPDIIRTKNRCKCTGFEALHVILRRFASSGESWNRMVYLFGRKRSWLQSVFYYMVKFLWQNWSHLLLRLDTQRLTGACPRFGAAVLDKGCPCDAVWGFLDGTVRGVSRPTRLQRNCYNGHKRKHAMKYQGIMCPDGIFAQMFGPVVGRRHDSYLLHASGLVAALEADFTDVAGVSYYLYADPAYQCTRCIMSGFKGANITADQQDFNTQMSSVRECVEWGFGGIINLFPYIDNKRMQRLMQQPVGKFYILSSLFYNIHTCLYGNQTSVYFDCDPPTVEEYLRTY